MNRIYGIFDKKSEVHVSFFLSNSDVNAMRSFSSAVNDINTNLYQYHEDFTLDYLGNILIANPVLLTSATAVLRPIPVKDVK